ncbi:MAG: A24 family peptidase [Lachnospiraceae bacterium]|nr:A24 family peptidase [Lachnospiraceae bacterium]
MLRRMVLACFLAMACFWDDRHGRIPNRLIVLMTVVGMGWSAFLQVSFRTALMGMLLPFLALFPLFLMRVLGAGDIKLLSAAGVYLGHQSWRLVVISLFLGGMAGLILLLRRGLFWKRIREGLIYLMTLFRGKELVPYHYGIDSREAITIPFSWCVFGASGMIWMADWWQ